MRHLPCTSSGCDGAMLPSGDPYLAASLIRSYKCARCKRQQTLTAAGFARLPRLTLEDFHRHGLGDRALRDLVGTGLAEEHAADMFRAGFQTAHEVAAVEKGAP